MSTPFDPDDGLIVVSTRVSGPRDEAVISMALDTGASSTLISAAILRLLGYDPALSETRVRVTTGSGVEYAPRISVRRIEALERNRLDFPVLSHTLPPTAGVDGLLDLDFLRGATHARFSLRNDRSDVICAADAARFEKDVRRV